MGHYYGIRELADVFQVSENLIMRQIKEKGVEVVRLGKVIRVHESEVSKLLTPNRPGLEA